MKIVITKQPPDEMQTFYQTGKLPAKEPRKIGWLSRLVRFLRDMSITIACITAILWLAKCPGNLELWRPICIGLILPIIQRFLPKRTLGP